MMIQGHIAVAVGSSSEPKNARIAVLRSSGPEVLQPDRFVDLVLEHGDSPIACFDIGNLFSSLECHFRSNSRHEYVRSLFSVASACRFHDIQLFDQLIGLARSGINPDVRTIDELSFIYSNLNATSEDQAVDRLIQVQSESVLGNASLAGPQLVAEAYSISEIYSTQSEMAAKVATATRIPNEFVDRYGPLSVGLQGQGAIAMARLRRTRLVIRKDAVPEARDLLNRVYDDTSERLSRRAKSKACFRWSGDKIRRSNQGLPVQRPNELRSWLAEIAEATPTIHETPLIPPLTVEGKISIIPDVWGDELLLHRELQDWVNLWVSAQGLKFLDVPDVIRSRPDCIILPRLMTTKPNIDRLRRLGLKSIFEAEEGRTLAVGRMEDLALRCFAEDIQGLGRPSRIARELFDETDLIYASARLLFAQRRAFTELGEESGDEFDDRTIRAKEDFDDDDFGADREECMNLARGLIDAMLLGLDSRLTREYLEEKHQISVDPEEAHQYWLWLIDGLADTIDPVSEDLTFNLLLERFKCQPEELKSVLMDVCGEWGMTVVRQLIMGRIQSAAKFDRLRSVCRDELLLDRLQIDRGSPQLFRELFGTFVPTNTGQARRVVALTETMRMTHASLADDVMKAVLFGLMAAGFEPIIWADDEFVISITSNEISPETLTKIAEAAKSAARRVLHSVPLSCKVDQVQVW